jgi:hypothetical protein
MPKLPGISCIRAFEKKDFKIIREGKHISMSNGERIIIIPRANPINAYTLGGIIKDSGISLEEFKSLL